MKLHVKASYDLGDMDYIPHDIADDIDDIIDSLKEEIENKFGRRYKNLQVDIEGKRLDDHTFEADVLIYNNGKVIREAHFSFAAYDSYFDETDYIQHINTRIHNFVSNLNNR